MAATPLICDDAAMDTLSLQPGDLASTPDGTVHIVLRQASLDGLDFWELLCGLARAERLLTRQVGQPDQCEPCLTALRANHS